jgi:hypothetical protein
MLVVNYVSLSTFSDAPNCLSFLGILFFTIIQNLKVILIDYEKKVILESMKTKKTKLIALTLKLRTLPSNVTGISNIEMDLAPIMLTAHETEGVKAACVLK